MQWQNLMPEMRQILFQSRWQFFLVEKFYSTRRVFFLPYYYKMHNNFLFQRSLFHIFHKTYVYSKIKWWKWFSAWYTSSLLFHLHQYNCGLNIDHRLTKTAIKICNLPYFNFEKRSQNSIIIPFTWYNVENVKISE